MDISRISGASGITGSNPLLRGVGSITQEKSEGSQFKNVLIESIKEVNQMQRQADNLVERMAAGEDVGTAEVLTAVQKADIAFKMMMQMRNKLTQAYQEVQNIRV